MRLLPATILALVLGVTSASANQVSFDGSWKNQKFSLFSTNRYAQQGDTLGVSSDGTVSLLYSAVPRSLWSSGTASWRWQVSQSVPATDLTRKGGDDRNLALYFVFLPEDQARQLRGSSVARLLNNKDVRVLVYVWGGGHARGAMLPSPYLGVRGKTVVLRPSGTGQAGERVELSRDYARAFGGEPTALVGLAISGDSDDTDSSIRAQLANLRLN
ncbi:DUF3047 domain-containing protein [Roseovarius aestuariivivens]|uniref:DUF3047 domain-containing protein n=1 Tax=Roseovarius aestuariivivens TaxID=1888910 RepID=UPI001081FCAB|nr:DUF3047 domain-containing protein [Roseovarius aestuariivivens]